MHVISDIFSSGNSKSYLVAAGQASHDGARLVTRLCICLVDATQVDYDNIFF